MKSDGTVNGTSRVAVATSVTGELVNVAGALFFPGTENGGTSFKLWKSDGTPGGTISIAPIPPVYNAANIGGRLFFAAVVSLQPNYGEVTVQLLAPV